MSDFFTHTICQSCKDSGNVEVVLRQIDNEMVCPKCAVVDEYASSMINHVDVSDVTGQIVDGVQSLQSMDRSRIFSGDKNERRYTVSTEGSFPGHDLAIKQWIETLTGNRNMWMS